MYYRKKPITVRAIQWNGPEDNVKCAPANITGSPSLTLRMEAEWDWFIDTIEANLRLTPGCWIVGPGARGEYWPVQNDIFQETYERVE